MVNAELDFEDVLLLPQPNNYHSRNDVNLEESFYFKNAEATWCGVPIIASNMDGVGTFEMARELSKYKILTALTKHYTLNELVEFLEDEPYSVINHTIYSIGINQADLTKYNEFKKIVGQPSFVCIDAANFYTEFALEFLRNFRKENPHTIILCGNVVDGQRVLELVHAGADIIKIGIGSSRVCTTREMTGIGRPQLSTIMDCHQTIKDCGSRGFLCSDGGITCPGDAAKAFAAGAKFIMLGGFMSGHAEGGGEIINGKIKFYGMSSNTAMEIHANDNEYRTSEGRTVMVDYKGLVKDTIRQLLGGLRSAITYTGAASLSTMYKNAKFVKVNRTLDRYWEKK